MQFREASLENGLEIIAECNPKAYSSAAAFFVKTGARDETDEVSGVSHFLEHMVFKGTAKRSAADVNRELDEISPNANAFTSEEQTVYYAAFLPEYTDRAVALLSDIMRPSLREDDFTTEKQVILEEIAKYEDQPPFGAHEKCMAAHFLPHPLGRCVLGSIASVSSLTPERMRDYFQRRYSPSNMTLVGAGNIDFAEFVEMAKRNCAQWEPFENNRVANRPEPRTGFHVIHKPTATQQYVLQLANGPAAEDDDRYAARVLAPILGDDSGSRMFWELVDNGLAECAAMSAEEYQHAGAFMTFLCCTPEETEGNLQRIFDLQRKAEKTGVSESELRQAKSKICSHIVLRSERPANRLISIGSNWIQRHEYRTVRQAVEAYQAVTCQDVAAVLKKYPLSYNTTLAVGPLATIKAPS